MAKAKGLGRGLDALFPEEKQEISGLRIKDIEPNPNQPRRSFDEVALNDLAESIAQSGVITPIAVRKTGDTYQIIAGERRWRASRLAGLNEIPAVILDVDEKTAYQLALVENLQREDLNPIEEAKGYQTLMDHYGLTQEQAAQQVGKSRSAVANVLRLLALPLPVKSMVEEGLLSEGHARVLLRLNDPEQLEMVARQVIREGLSVRQTEEMIPKLTRKKREKEVEPSKDAIYIKDLEREMEGFIGHKIFIHHREKKGKLTIEYYGNEDLEKICEALKKLEK